MGNRVKLTKSERMLIREGILTEDWVDKLKTAGEAGKKGLNLVKKLRVLLKSEDPIDIMLTLLALIPGTGFKLAGARYKIKETLETLKPFIGEMLKGGNIKDAVANLNWEDLEPVLAKHGDTLKQLKAFVGKHGEKIISIAGIIKNKDMEGLEKFIGFSIPVGKDKVAAILEKLSAKIGDKADSIKKIIDVISAFPLEKPKGGGTDDTAALAASYTPRGRPLFETSIIPYVLSDAELNEMFRRVGEGLVAVTR